MKDVILLQEERDKYRKLLKQLNAETRAHSKNVAIMCRLCAQDLSLDRDIAYHIGLFHDVGKIYAPSRILKKNGALSVIEREVIDLHAYWGYRLLKDLGERPVVYVPVLFHHGFEKYKLINMQEPMTREIMDFIFLIHSVDIYDAMASRRTYHDPYPLEEICEQLDRDALCNDQIVQSIRHHAYELEMQRIKKEEEKENKRWEPERDEG